MASSANASQTKRRMSVNLFSRSSIPSLTRINTDGAPNTRTAPLHDSDNKKDGKKLKKRNSLFGIGPSSEEQIGTLSPIDGDKGSPRLRPRTLQKGRPSSIFGSLGRKSSHIERDEGENDNLCAPESPLDTRHLDLGATSSKTVLHYGEVQTTSGMFRKKKEFLVLTDTHLIRFKSQSRASEAFPGSIPYPGSRNSVRHPSTTSIGSLQDGQSTLSHASSESESRIPLGQIVTAYKVEDGRPFFTTEVVFLDEEYQGAGSLQLILHDPKEADLWHGSIRGAAQKARLMLKEPYPERIVKFLADSVEHANDYDLEHFKVFRVVQRAAATKVKTSSDDLQKLGASVFYMVIGINRLHLIPLPDYSDASRRLVQPKTGRCVFGIVTLVSMTVSFADDRFELAFRTPFQPVKLLELAASATPDIAVELFGAHHFLKPQWLDYSFSFKGPRQLIETAVYFPHDELGSFDRTLVAYCMAYNCNPTNIQYAVDWDTHDAPEFRLYSPVYTKRYSTLEALAIMRALRYNECFRSISFRDVDLHGLHGWRDKHGSDHVAWTTREGDDIQAYFTNLHHKSVLYQEVQALALKSRQLEKMDFSNTLPGRRPKEFYDVENEQDTGIKDSGTEIVAGLLPLLREQLTNVSWIGLNDIDLGEADLDDILPALSRPEARIRAIECQHSSLTDRGIMQLLNHMEKQGNSIEYINIANNPGRIHLGGFQVSMSRFTRLRKLNLSRMTRLSGGEPLFTPLVLLSWRLEELTLTGIPVNTKTLESISSYLESNMSDDLALLEMEQCNLSGSDVALLMRSMTRVPGKARDLLLQVSANRIEKGVGDVVKAIEDNQTPSHLIIRMIEFTKEDHFRQLLEALRKNTTIRSLDISKASLPYDASPQTCEALRLMFVHNSTLEELDISGEHAHLEVTRFGIGLSEALTGLTGNNALKVLRIEHQNLGLAGANTLATVFESNKSLTHVQCDHNNISLQGFTILVNSVAANHTIVDLPFMQDDQEESMKKLELNMRNSRRVTNTAERRTPMRRTLTVLGVSKTPKQEVALSTFDVASAVREVNDMWKSNMARLSSFLDRNRKLAMGMTEEDIGMGLGGESLRPTTAMSEREIIDLVLSNTTPRIELNDPHDTNPEIAASKISTRNGDEDSTPRKGSKAPILPSLEELGLTDREKDKGPPRIELKDEPAFEIEVDEY